MPARRSPTLTLAASGALARSPGRHAGRATEPRPNPLPSKAPAHLGAAERLVWRQLFDACPAGVLGVSDAFVLELAAVLLAAFRAAPVTFPAAKLSQLRLALDSLGMSPVSRSRICVLPGRPDTPERRAPDTYFT